MESSNIVIELTWHGYIHTFNFNWVLKIRSEISAFMHGLLHAHVNMQHIDAYLSHWIKSYSNRVKSKKDRKKKLNEKKEEVTESNSSETHFTCRIWCHVTSWRIIMWRDANMVGFYDLWQTHEQIYFIFHGMHCNTFLLQKLNLKP